ncbi:MAG: hypothetical protein ACK5YR_16540 [Pirellula sp.]|jgi:hypothetical protein
MKSFNKDGWEFRSHDRNKDLFSIPSTTICENEKIYVQEVHIAHSQGLTRTVFFVSGKNGDEYGQFKNAAEAIAKYNEVSNDNRLTVVQSGTPKIELVEKFFVGDKEPSFVSKEYAAKSFKIPRKPEGL